MQQLYILFEHASGYAVFRTTEFEEIAIFLPQVQNSILDVSKFRSVVYLVSFQLFQNGQEALENMRNVAAGTLNKHLQLFLESNVPKSKKGKQSVVLGVQDPELANNISEKLNISCCSSGVISEIIRGIRHHFHKLVKGFKDLNAANKAQMALAHQFARYKLNFDKKRCDSYIIHSLNILGQLEKDVNILTKRIRGWFSSHFPELSRIISDNITYVKCVRAIQNRENMPEDIENQLMLILKEHSKVQEVLTSASTSMGMSITSSDVENIKTVTDRVLSLQNHQQIQTDYVKSKMQQVAPNLSILVGEMVGAQLISRAGGLANLAKYPASTIQVLGAQKALFRNLKNSPHDLKRGFIADSVLLKKVSVKNKGRVSRCLANKCCLASRIDYFRKTTSDTYGHTFSKQTEDYLKLCENKKVQATAIISADTLNQNKKQRIENDTDSNMHETDEIRFHISSVPDLHTEESQNNSVITEKNEEKQESETVSDSEECPTDEFISHSLVCNESSIEDEKSNSMTAEKNEEKQKSETVFDSEEWPTNEIISQSPVVCDDESTNEDELTNNRADLKKKRKRKLQNIEKIQKLNAMLKQSNKINVKVSDEQIYEEENALGPKMKKRKQERKVMSHSNGVKGKLHTKGIKKFNRSKKKKHVKRKNLK